jgi:hypothetical protein
VGVPYRKLRRQDNEQTAVYRADETEEQAEEAEQRAGRLYSVQVSEVGL